MKSLDGVNKKNDVNNTASEAPEKNVKTESEKIDFSKVKVEPLFEEFVDFDTFSKSDFRAVKVKECVAVPKSKKLLQFTLDDGTGTDRTILSGIHAYYEPEELVGKTLIAITNLPPRAMMGIESCGMLLSAIHEEEGEENYQIQGWNERGELKSIKLSEASTINAKIAIVDEEKGIKNYDLQSLQLWQQDT